MLRCCPIAHENGHYGVVETEAKGEETARKDDGWMADEANAVLAPDLAGFRAGIGRCEAGRREIPREGGGNGEGDGG